MSRLLSAAALMLCSSAASAATIPLQDGDFGSWTAIGVGGFPAQVTAQETTGGAGDNGAYWRVGTPSNVSYVTFSYDPSMTYDPMNGAIDQITFDLDWRQISGGSNIMAYYLMIEQGGTIFQGTYTITGTSGSWTSAPSQTMTSSDFIEIGAGSSNPDFSTAGDVITFGLGTGNSNSAGVVYGYDNFSAVLETTPVPLPAPALFLIAGVAGLAALRKRTA